MKIVAFTTADKSNEKYAEMMMKSFKHFHPEIDMVFFGEDAIKDLGDPHFFYRQKATVAKQLIDKYDLVLGLDADQLITGRLDFIFDREDYDVGVVYNWNRVDPAKYGDVSIATIAPTEYYNCGLVAMRSKEFVDHWYRLCHSKFFERTNYREQGLLNLITHYGNYKVRCFDDYDAVYGYRAWHGLISKGEWNKCVIKDGKMILPKGEDGYPADDTEIKVIHTAGGNTPNKMNYRINFNEECIEYLDNILK